MPPRGPRKRKFSADTDSTGGAFGDASAHHDMHETSLLSVAANASSSSDDAGLAALSAAFPSFTSPLHMQQQPSPPPQQYTMSNTSATRSFSKRSQLSAREKLAVIEWYYAHGKNQQATAAHFKSQPRYERLSQSSVSRYIAGEAKIRELVDSGRANVVRVNAVRNPNFENILIQWLDRLGGHDASRLSSDLIKQTAVKVYEHLQTPEHERLELSNGWLRSFQQRHCLKGGKPRRSLTSTGNAPGDAPPSLSPQEADDSDVHALEAPGTPTSGAVGATPALLSQALRHTEALGTAPPASLGLESESMVQQLRYTALATSHSVPSPLEPCANNGATHSPPSHMRRQLQPTPLAGTSAAQAMPPAAGTSARRTAGGPLASVPDFLIKREQERVAVTIREFLSWDHRRSLADVWTLDEVALAYAHAPVAPTDGSMARAPDARPSLTVALAINADGSERRDPLIIGRSEHPRSFKHDHSASDLGFQYVHNRGAWMTSDIFDAYVSAWNAELVAQERHVLVLVDSYSGHKLGKKVFENVQLEYFGARVTEIIQPFCDAAGGIARAFRACYRRLVVLRAADRLLSALDSVDCARAFEIDQLAAMDLIVRAWPLVQRETAVRCWRNAKILPMDQASNRTDVRPSKLALREVETLQSALFFLSAEARAKGLALDTVDATVVADADADTGAGDDARLEELVQFTVGSRDGASASDASGPSAALVASTNAPDVMRTPAPVHGMMTMPMTSMATMNGDGRDDDDDRGTQDLNPVLVYRSLLTLEQYWREQPLQMSDDVRKLLQLSRAQLQGDISRAREAQAAAAAAAQQQQQQNPSVNGARNRRK